MGNASSSTTSNSELATEIDRIASHYILSQTYDDMNKLSEKNHCDKLVILTAKIINNNLNPLQQKAVVERIQKAGASAADTADTADASAADTADTADTAEDCVKIAKFYVKIAHLYAAIMKTINPVILSKDETGKTKKYSLMTKQTMPSDAEIKNIQHNNFCTLRLNTLMQESDINKTNPENKVLTVTPRFCTMNYDPKTKKTRKFYEGDKDNMKEKQIFGGADDNKNKKNDSENDDEDDEDKNNKDKNNKNKNDKNKKSKEDNEEDEEEEGAEENPSKSKKNKYLKKNKGEEEEDEDDDDVAKDQYKNKYKDKNKEKEKEKKKEKEIAKPIKETPIPMDSAEIGIPELMKLYYDVYDEKKKDYTNMSLEMKKIYQNDVDTFYRTFTGKEVETDENGDKKITSFEQIPLNEYHKSDGCKPDGVYTKSYEGSLNKTDLNENLFEKYASHVNKMMNTMNSNQDSLLKILKKLFIFKKHVEEPKIIEKEDENSTNNKEDVQQSKQESTPKEEIPVVYQAQAQAIPAAQAQAVPAVQEQAIPAAQEQSVPEAQAQQIQTSDINKNEQKGGESKKEEQDAIINPALDESLLQNLINAARQLIVKLYITCETDFVEGLHIFEAIVATQLGRNVNSQIKLLDELTLEYLANKNTEEEVT